MSEQPAHWYGLGEPACRLAVRGLPAPQGSKRHVGNGRMVESSAKVKPWREDVRAAALEWIEMFGTVETGGTVPWTPFDGALRVSMVFAFRRSASHYRTGKNSHLLRDAAPTHPLGPPDLSKLLRATEDAITSAGLWHDDARVVQYVNLAKVFCGEGVDALEVPGVVVRIWTTS